MPRFQRASALFSSIVRPLITSVIPVPY